LFEGRELWKIFDNSKIGIVPQAKGKMVIGKRTKE